MQNFIDFVQNLFPSIDPYTAASAKQSMDQFLNLRSGNCLMSCIDKSIIQGDIIFDLPFTIYDSEGNKYIERFPGLVLTHSCDIENDNFVAIAPLQPIEGFLLDKVAIKNNRYYHLFFLPDQHIDDYVVNFSMINTFHKNMLIQAIDQERIKHQFTLNLFGYYCFLCKLTVHFMRPDDEGLQKLRFVDS